MVSGGFSLFIGSSDHLPLRLRPAVPLTDDELFELCQRNGDLRIERTPQGELIIMTPTGGATGKRNFNLIGQFWAWVNVDASGVGFDSSTGFLLPNGAERAPDLAWVALPRWNAVPKEQREKFLPLCPDFVVELRSPSEPLPELMEKMLEYMACGARLGWLIDPFEQSIHVYSPGEAARVLQRPTTVSGEPLLKGFTLELSQIWT